MLTRNFVFTLFIVILFPLTCRAADSPSRNPESLRVELTARSQIADVLSRFPPDIETLVAIREPWVIPDSRPDPRAMNGLPIIARDSQLSFVLDRDFLWNKLAGKSVRLWVEGARNFRLPGLKGARGIIHDGCQVFVFHEDISEDLQKLFRAFRGARGRIHTVGETSVAEYVPRSLQLSPHGFSYWIAAPDGRTLLIATDLPFLQAMLAPEKEGRQAFPEDDPWWQHVNSDATVWGMRKYKAAFGGADFSDIRWHSVKNRSPGSTSGFVFQWKDRQNRAEVLWLDCDQQMTRTLTESARQRISSNSSECDMSSEDGRFQMIVRWPDGNDESEAASRRRIRIRIGLWLTWHLGHAAAV